MYIHLGIILGMYENLIHSENIFGNIKSIIMMIIAGLEAQYNTSAQAHTYISVAEKYSGPPNLKVEGLSPLNYTHDMHTRSTVPIKVSPT